MGYYPIVVWWVPNCPIPKVPAVSYKNLTRSVLTFSSLSCTLIVFASASTEIFYKHRIFYQLMGHLTPKPHCRFQNSPYSGTSKSLLTVDYTTHLLTLLLKFNNPGCKLHHENRRNVVWWANEASTAMALCFSVYVKFATFFILLIDHLIISSCSYLGQ